MEQMVFLRKNTRNMLTPTLLHIHTVLLFYLDTAPSASNPDKVGLRGAKLGGCSGPVMDERGERKKKNRVYH